MKFRRKSRWGTKGCNNIVEQEFGIKNNVRIGEEYLPAFGLVTFGINLTVLDVILSADRCQNELNEFEFSSVMFDQRDLPKWLRLIPNTTSTKFQLALSFGSLKALDRRNTLLG